MSQIIFQFLKVIDEFDDNLRYYGLMAIVGFVGNVLVYFEKSNSLKIIFDSSIFVSLS